MEVCKVAILYYALYHDHAYFLLQDVLLKVKCTLNVVLHVPQLEMSQMHEFALYSVWQDVNAPMVLYLMKKITSVSKLTNAVRLELAYVIYTN